MKIWVRSGIVFVETFLFLSPVARDGEVGRLLAMGPPFASPKYRNAAHSKTSRQGKGPENTTRDRMSFQLLRYHCLLLLHRHRLRQVPRLVNVASTAHSDVIRQQLKRDDL